MRIFIFFTLHINNFLHIQILSIQIITGAQQAETISRGPDLDKGLVQVFQENEGTGEWEQIGSDLFETFDHIYYTEFGYDLSISSDGQTLVVTARCAHVTSSISCVGAAYIYKRNLNGDDWYMHQRIYNGDDGFIGGGGSVALSKDASTLVYAAGLLTAGSEWVQVYELCDMVRRATLF